MRRRPTSAPRFCVVIAAHNAQETIAATLESVQAQTCQSWEAWVVDDGSTDDTSDIVGRFAEHDRRVHVIRQTNSGTGSARNAAAARAQAEFLCILDADDEYRPNYLESQTAFIDLHPGFDIYSCNADAVLASGAVEPFDPTRYPRTLISLRLEDMIPANRIFVAAVVRASSFKSVGGFREHVYVEDYDLWLRLLAGGRTHIHNPMSLVLYRVADRGKTTHPTRALESMVEVYRHLAATEAIDRLLVAAIRKQVRDTEGLIARLEAQAGWTELRGRLSAADYSYARRRYWAVRKAPIGRVRYVAGLGLVALSPRLLAAAIRDSAAGSRAARPPAGEEARGPVSVIVYCDGRERPLAATLESLARQTLAEFTVLLAGMPPGDRELPRLAPGLYGVKGHRVDCVALPGAASARARNRAIGAIGGRFVLELDSGDRIEPTALEKAAWAMETTPQAGLIAIGEPRPMRKHQGFGPIGLVNSAAETAERGTYLLRVAAWRANEGFDTKAPAQAADQDLWIRSLERGWEAWTIPEALVHPGREPASRGEANGELADDAAAQRWLRSRHRRFYLRAAASARLGGASRQVRRHVPILPRFSRWVAWKLDVEGLGDRRLALRHPLNSLLRLAPGPLKGRLWRRLNLPPRPEAWTYDPPLADVPGASCLSPTEWTQPRSRRERKTRLLVLHQYLVPGGAEAVALNLLTQIDRDRFDIAVITTDYEPGGKLDHPWLARFAEQTSDIYQLPTFLERDRFLRFIVDLISSRGIDVVLISLSIFGYQALPKLRAACPHVAFVDLLHAEAPYAPMDHVRLASRYRQFLDRRVVITDALREVQISKYGETPPRVVVIPNAIDTAGAYKPKGSRGAFRQELGIGGDVAMVLHYGRMWPEKRPMHVVDVAEYLRDRSDVAFVLLGDGPETPALEKAIAARRLTNVHLKPARDDIGDVLADADIVMFPSEREGLPIAGIESMSMGKPIVASKVPGWVELVADGVDGFLIESGDIPGYAAAITRLLGDRALYDRMSRAARDKATSQYDLAGSIRTWERLLATLSANARDHDA